MHIRGLGECTGMRLYLAYPEDCFRLTVPANVPQPYQEGWNIQMDHAKQKQASLPENNILEAMKQEIEQDLRAAETLPPPSGIKDGWINGPIVTFAMPKNSPLVVTRGTSDSVEGRNSAPKTFWAHCSGKPNGHGWTPGCGRSATTTTQPQTHSYLHQRFPVMVVHGVRTHWTKATPARHGRCI